MVEILGGDAVERAQPFLQPPMVAVYVVDMEVGGLASGAAGRGQDAAGDLRLAGEADDRLAAIAAELVVRGDNTIECGGDRSAVEFGENGIGGQAVSITGDENGDLLLGQASLGRLSAALTGGTRQVRAFALERFQNERLVDLDPLRRLGLSSAGAERNR